MDMEKIYGSTKGTELEGIVKQIMQAEANGTMMYEALAMLADAQDLGEAASRSAKPHARKPSMQASTRS